MTIIFSSCSLTGSDCEWGIWMDGVPLRVEEEGLAQKPRPILDTHCEALLFVNGPHNKSEIGARILRSERPRETLPGHHAR